MKFTATFCIAAIVALVSAQAEPESSVSSTLSETLSETSSEMMTSSSMMTTTMMASSTETMPATSISVSLTPQQSCASDCRAGDVDCMAACYGVPNPSNQQANQTNECAGRCSQGSGSQADTEAYGRCQQSCITSIYLSTRTETSSAMETGVVGAATTLPTTGSAMTSGSTMTASGSGSASGTSSATGSASRSSTTSGSSSTGTGTASAASSTPSNAAGHLQIGAPVAGLAGIVAALMAL